MSTRVLDFPPRPAPSRLEAIRARLDDGRPLAEDDRTWLLELARQGMMMLAGVEPLLDAEAAAFVLGIDPKNIYELDIPCVQLSTKRKRWRPSVLAQWILDREGRG